MKNGTEIKYEDDQSNNRRFISLRIGKRYSEVVDSFSLLRLSINNKRNGSQ